MGCNAPTSAATIIQKPTSYTTDLVAFYRFRFFIQYLIMKKNFSSLGLMLVTLCCCLDSTDTFADPKVNVQKLKALFPAGYTVLDNASGDLDGDGLKDYVFVLQNDEVRNDPDEVRPLLIIMGKPKGKFEVLSRNDRVVLCSTCGGMYLDPYERLTIKDGLLTVHHKVGSNWIWTREISFRYDPLQRQMILQGDSGVSYHVSAPSKYTTIVTNKEDFSKVSFSCFDYNKKSGDKNTARL